MQARDGGFFLRLSRLIFGVRTRALGRFLLLFTLHRLPQLLTLRRRNDAHHR